MNTRTKIAGTLLAFLLGTAWVSAQDPPTWNRKAASTYLDGSASAWKANRTTSRPNQTSCISCHTALPYLLARPALNPAGDASETTEEKALLRDVRARVAGWRDVEPWYRSKRDESLGTEAILNAVILAARDAKHQPARNTETTKKAFDHLWSLQRTQGGGKGSWAWLDYGLDPWESKQGEYWGACLAAVAVGTLPDDYARGDAVRPKVDLLAGYLQRGLESDLNLHNQAALLWASSTLPGILKPEQRETIQKALFAAQRPDGGWSLDALGDWKREPTGSDGYATGYVVFALRKAGVKREHPQLARGLAWLTSNQTPTGSWASESVNVRRNGDDARSRWVRTFMPDAATAYGVLALTDE